MPQITVITAVRNARALVAETIESVLSQRYPALEYVIVDGASTDGTHEVIGRYSDSLAHWIREPDRGISEAFNKGIAGASGQLIGILNAGDRYLDGALEAVADAWRHQQALASRRPAGVVYHGDLAYHDETGSFAFVAKPDPSKIWRRMSVFHPTMFVERSVYERVGGYATDLAFAMDCDFVHRVVRAGVRLVYVPRVLAAMRAGGASDEHFRHAAREFRDSVIRHGGAPVAAHVRCYVSIVRHWASRTPLGRRLARGGRRRRA